MRGYINAGCLILFMFTVFMMNLSNASAEIIPVEGKAEYTFDIKFFKGDISAATEQVRDEAKRKAAEQAGLYVESHSESIKGTLMKDKITVIAMSILEDIEEDIHPEPDGKNIKIVCIINAKVNTDKLNPELMVNKNQQIQEMIEKDKIIQELKKENQRLMEENKKATSESQKQQIQDEFDKNQHLFLIAKYERDLDIYDFSNKINWNEMMTTAQKLSDIDPQNATAFRTMIYYYREQDNLKSAIDYCNKMLNSNCPPDIAIEAYCQLGDIYYNELNNKNEARQFVDKGIAVVKKQYTPALIEKLVNGTDVRVSEFVLVGKSNSIRELYILKSEIENLNPNFKAKTIVQDMVVEEDKIYDIRYRTNW